MALRTAIYLTGLAIAQTLSNWGEQIRSTPGTLISVIGSVSNRQGGTWFHSGALYITDTIENYAGNEMFIPIFPNGVPVSPGKVQLWGGYQWITGSDPIHFDTLELRGSSSKNLAQDAYVRHWLDLGDQMFNTHAETLFHRQPAPYSVVRGTGFVRSSRGGALERTCMAGERYLYPVGDSLPILRYRPFYLTPSGDGRYAGRFAAGDATGEGYDRSQKDPRLCLINPHYFHHISGPTGGFLELSFDPPVDGNYDASAHWTGSQWDSIGGVLITISPFSYITQSVLQLSPTPFALAVRQPRAKIIPPGPHELCPGDSLQLMVEQPDPNWTYIWSHGATGPTVWITAPGSYTVTVQGPQGCSFVSAPVEVRGLPHPFVAISPSSPQSICPGDTLWLTATAALSYQWFYEGLPLIGAQSQSFPATQPGTYTVQAVQRCGVAESTPFVLTWHALPIAYFTVSPPDSVEMGQPVTFTDSTQGGYAWQWWIGTQSFPGSPTLTYSFPRDSFYTITLISQNAHGCRDTFSRTIYVRPFSGIFIPTAFSPNGDGVNDVFFIVAPPLEWSRLRIYSRWGLLIREITSSLSWDGKDEAGHLVPEDVYTFTFEGRLFSGQSLQRVGTVTLVR
ncbi:MAG: gliding motility-associated C-terminal domain-containing protein [Bacteroidia bacterium]|nr:gliding motility-associated C-terminal domain-containing protein [Bacteroidia bacterium]